MSPEPPPDSGRNLIRLLRALSVLLAMALSWLARYAFDPDGVAYADVARAWLRGDWHNALNTYWSPLYSWLLAIGFGILHPPIAWETWIPHAIVFLGFLASLASAEWMLREWERWQGPPAHRTLVTISFFSLFLWATLRLTGMEFTSADIFLVAVWCMTAALLIRIRSGIGGTRDAVWFGVILAFGFFTKGGFLSAIPMFLAALVGITGLRDRRPYLAAAATLCTLLPFGAAMSLAHGRLVLSDAAWLNYSWLVTGAAVEGYHQSDAPPPTDIPHPVLRLLDKPRVLSYQDHVVGTIPIHSDAAWWSEGYPVEFDFDRQFAVLANEGSYTLGKALRSPALIFFLLCLISAGWHRTAVEFGRLWFLWIPALGALLFYSSIHILDRYISPPLVVLGFAMIAAGWKSQPSFGQATKPAVTAITLVLSVVGLASVRYQLNAPLSVWEEMAGTRQPADIGTVQVASYLHSLSPLSGPRIGLIGSSIVVPWLELARGQMVTVVPGRLGNESWAPGRPSTLSFGEVDGFWKSDAETQAKVFAAMRQAGADWVVADSVPVWADVTGWDVAGPAIMIRPPGVQRPSVYVRHL